MMRLYWLSFVDSARPEGERNLGVCIVEVTEEDAADAKEDLEARFPQHRPGAEWIAAACRKAHLLGCNPGGEVGAAQMTEEFMTEAQKLAPRGRLMQRKELEHLGLIETHQ